MAQKLERSTVRRAGRWLKWKGLRVVQLLGFALIAIGAYPFARPFLAAVATPPEALDSFVESFGISLAFLPDATAGNLRAIVFVALGAVVVWVTTSRRLR